jgi:hypothetical protein
MADPTRVRRACLATPRRSFPDALAARLPIGIDTSASCPAMLFLVSDRAADSGDRAPPGVLSVLLLSASGMTALGPALIAVFGRPSIFWR